jgi:L-ascorbate metabolism protein UlaG (beta-lactamase superfamily)
LKENNHPSAMTHFTFCGHSCFGITLPCGTRLLFDPFIRPNELAKHIDVDAIHPLILTSSSLHRST